MSSMKSYLSSHWPVLTHGSVKLSSLLPVYLSWVPLLGAGLLFQQPLDHPEDPVRRGLKKSLLSSPAPPTMVWLGFSLALTWH